MFILNLRRYIDLGWGYDNVILLVKGGLPVYLQKKNYNL